MRESDSEVNIQVGVLSGLLQKEVTIKFSVAELNAISKSYLFHNIIII